MLKQAFIGPDGKLRAIWRAAMHYAVRTWLVFPLLDWWFALVTESLHLSPGLSAANIGFGEFRNLITAVICTGAFALYERRRVDSYGLPVNRAFGWQTLEGAAAGVIVAGAVAFGMIMLGGMRIKGLAGSGSAVALSALAWLGANIGVGIAEEFWFRSYLQHTLWKSMGFWPAATVIGVIFAAEHYLQGR
jgi:membrane protease YdiL (CAAX protease family)